MKKIILISLMLSILLGCTSTNLKAPCNATGSNCGPRIKINTIH